MIHCYVWAQRLLNNTVSETPSYVDRTERDACVLARKTVFFKFCMHDKAEIRQPFPLWEQGFGQEVYAHLTTRGEDLSESHFQRRLSRRCLPSLFWEGGSTEGSTFHSPGVMCISNGEISAQEIYQNMYLELSPREVCTLDLIFQNSSLFEWWRPCLKNLRNVISLVSFLVLALRLEREKSGSSSHHLKSPFPMTLAGKKGTEQKAFKLMNAIFCSRRFFNRGKSTWCNRTPKTEQLQLTRVVILHHFSVL